jgi:hypothetical protein
LVESLVKVVKREIPTFLTFSTGWRYHKKIIKLRKISLQSIKEAILKDDNK